MSNFFIFLGNLICIHSVLFLFLEKVYMTVRTFNDYTQELTKHKLQTSYLKVSLYISTT